MLQKDKHKPTCHQICSLFPLRLKRMESWTSRGFSYWKQNPHRHAVGTRALSLHGSHEERFLLISLIFWVQICIYMRQVKVFFFLWGRGLFVCFYLNLRLGLNLRLLGKWQFLPSFFSKTWLFMDHSVVILLRLPLPSSSWRKRLRWYFKIWSNILDRKGHFASQLILSFPNGVAVNLLAAFSFISSGGIGKNRF